MGVGVSIDLWLRYAVFIIYGASIHWTTGLTFDCKIVTKTVILECRHVLSLIGTIHFMCICSEATN